MIPTSQIVDSSLVSSASDPSLSSDSILLKWRSVRAGGGFGSWCSSEQTIIIPGGHFMSWLVSLSSEEIQGFIIQSLSLIVSPPRIFLQFSYHLPPSYAFYRPSLLNVSHLLHRVLPFFFSKTFVSYIVRLQQ